MPDHLTHVESNAAAGQLAQARYPNELQRWTIFLGSPMLAGFGFVALAIATPFAWLFGGAVILGPFTGIAAIVYLALSSDTNGTSGQAVALTPRRDARAEATPHTAAA